MLTDTHCHLVSDKLSPHAADLIERAQLAGVDRIINIAYDAQTTAAGLDLSSRFDSLWTTCGIQPHDASTYSRELAEAMVQKASSFARCVAIGEIGLDAYYTQSPMEQQKACFEHFLDLACSLSLPVVVHVRETHKDVKERIAARARQNVKGVIHCFTGTTEEAREFLDLGFYISFSGIVTFKNAAALAETAKFIPADRLLIETDSPYLAPVPHRGRVNEPAYLRATAEFIATLRQSSFEDLAALTSTNATKLFRL